MSFPVHPVAIPWRLCSARDSPLCCLRQHVSNGLCLGAPIGEGVAGSSAHATVPLRRRKWRNRRPALPVVILIGGLLLDALFGRMTALANAQQTDSTVASNVGLPDAPGVGQSAQSGSGSIVGTVLDTNGDLIQGARVVLSGRPGTAEQVLQSGNHGEFAFSGLTPGSFKLTISAPGMGTYVSPEITLHAGETSTVSQVVLPFATVTADVTVVATRAEIAEAEIHLAEQQRVLGVLPNFYSVYYWNAAPLGTKQKFELAFRAVIDPVAFAEAGLVAGAEQANGSFSGYGQGAHGYAKRFGAAYANDFSGRVLASAVLPSLFHQDPRYFYKGTGSIRSRALYAITSAVICRGDNGHRQPNYSHILGSFAAGGLSNLYYPSTNRGLSLSVVNGLIDTAGNAGNNLLREFLLRRITSHAPKEADGEP